MYYKRSSISRRMRAGLLLVALSVAAALLSACGNTHPTVPGNFTVRAISSSEIKVTWDPSFDNGGISHYDLWRDNGYIASTPTTGYLDAGLLNSTTHCYTARAIGSHGDKSGFTSTLCDKTFPADDAGPPSMPTGLALSVLSDTEIELRWDASTDDLFVVGYHVYRDLDLINSITGTWMVDEGLVNSTRYCYQVTAYDKGDNESSLSDAECEYTLAP